MEQEKSVDSAYGLIETKYKKNVETAKNALPSK